MSRGVVVPVLQNPADGCGLGDESDDFHLGSAPAGQRVDVIDFADELRPSFSHRVFAGAGSPSPSPLFSSESRPGMEERTRFA